jgi:1,4-dihydroxy-2-naphthoate octaprenyltransferase
MRLPFLSASVLPFIFGSLIERKGFSLLSFFLGFAATAAMHLSANLFNDYADSRSGADWQEKKFYAFFGGSKLIQESIFSEKFYLKLAIFFTLLSFFCVVGLSIILKQGLILVCFAVIVFLGWSYSAGPLKFSYRRLGEVIIFLLFGPAVVMGGYFIQTKIFPDMKSFLLALPFGFFTTAILFANEIPDFSNDRKTGKHTWVGFSGAQRAYILYLALVFFGLYAIALNVRQGYLGFVALLSLLSIFPAGKAAIILKKFYQEKAELIASSSLTIKMHLVVSLILILGILR